MDDGSCCPKERYCEAGFDKVCCPEGQTCDGMGACITQCDSDTQHQCSNDTVSWCCDIGKSCGENATCIQCSPDNAKNDEALCIACGWEWTVWHRHGENIYSTGCGGNNWCQSKYPGSQWGVLVQKSDGDTEYWCLGQATCGPNETWFTWEDEYSSGGQCMEDG